MSVILYIYSPHPIFLNSTTSGLMSMWLAAIIFTEQWQTGTVVYRNTAQVHANESVMLRHNMKMPTKVHSACHPPRMVQCLSAVFIIFTDLCTYPHVHVWNIFSWLRVFLKLSSYCKYVVLLISLPGNECCMLDTFHHLIDIHRGIFPKFCWEHPPKPSLLEICLSFSVCVDQVASMFKEQITRNADDGFWVIQADSCTCRCGKHHS